MKHVNKPFGVNLIEQNNPGSNKNVLEGINLLLIISIGFVGLYWYSSMQNPKKQVLPFSNLTANADLSSVIPKGKSSATLVSPSHLQNVQLQVFGYKEAGESLNIVLDSFDPKADYAIDFGDGQHAVMDQKQINHQYQKPGNYKLQVIISYQDEPVHRINKKISIDSAIDVAQGAYEEK